MTPTPVNEVPPSTPPTPPDWVAESKLLQDALLYVRSLRAALNRPWAFASSWALGTEKPMNPLSFFSISLGIVFAVRGFERWVFDGAERLIEKTSIPSYVLPIVLGYYLHRTMLRKSGARLSLLSLAAHAGEGLHTNPSILSTVAMLSARSVAVGVFVAGAQLLGWALIALGNALISLG